MDIKEAKKPRHHGVETYTAELELAVSPEDGDAHDMQSVDADFEIRPYMAILVWERFKRAEGYGPWRRVTLASSRDPGSWCFGQRVLRNGTLSDRWTGKAQVFSVSDVGGRLAPDASLIPGLDLKIEMLEKNLPA